MTDDRRSGQEIRTAASPVPEHLIVLRLYVTGSTPRSTRAIENARTMCETHLKGDYDLEVVDIYEFPEAAKDADLIAAPTLIKQHPAPVRRIVGDLSDGAEVLHKLELGPGREGGVLQ